MILQTKTLYLSAGHSASDPGAVGNGHTEADTVLAFRDAVADELEGKVVFDRDGQKGQNLPLRKAAQQASSRDVAVEFHCNAATTGVDTLSHPEDFPLGQAISDTLGIPSRGAKPEGSGKHSRLAFVSSGGGIIVELFFISNPNDVAAYYRHKLAVARTLITGTRSFPNNHHHHLSNEPILNKYG